MKNGNGNKPIKPIEVNQIALRIPAALVKIAPARYVNMAAVAEIYPASDGQGHALLVVEFANGNFRKFASAVEQQALLEAAEALAIAPAAPSSNGTNDVEFVDAAPGDLTDEGSPYIY